MVLAVLVGKVLLSLAPLVDCLFVIPCKRGVFSQGSLYCW
jgi:hypothetical protein